ncbi:MAG: hypothetical protein ACN2B6_00635 [Rickettsiales bacterium]
MDRSSTFVVHFNSALNNQRVYAGYLSAGLSRLGLSHALVNTPNAEGDVHICIGPHFAFNECLGKPTIYIDRCLWGDDLDYVTIGWLKPDGGMDYPIDCDDQRPKPNLWPVKIGQNIITLFDYGMKSHPLALGACRYHPNDKKSELSLEDELLRYHVAIGWRSSALATALIKGLHVICYDERSPVYDYDIIGRKQWLNNMSYAQWSGKEIASGEALEYVLNNS